MKIRAIFETRACKFHVSFQLYCTTFLAIHFFDSSIFFFFEPYMYMAAGAYIVRRRCVYRVRETSVFPVDRGGGACTTRVRFDRRRGSGN